MITKQEIIKQAYGEHWDKVCDYVDEKGWCHGYFGIQMQELQGIPKPKKDPTIWRPKSLEGLENNNGWIKIESEEDLPNNSCSCWIQVKYQYTNTPFWYDFTKKCFVFKGIILFTNEITHYKPIEKTKPPIY